MLRSELQELLDGIDPLLQGEEVGARLAQIQARIAAEGLFDVEIILVDLTEVLISHEEHAAKMTIRRPDDTPKITISVSRADAEEVIDALATWPAAPEPLPDEPQ